ncbi:ribosome biogenesis protein MAK21, partial [Schistosoma bovis]
LILNIIINKLGDRSKEFASAVIHKLRLIEEAFTSMLSEVDDLFRLVHTTGFTVSVQALSVLFQISTHCVAIRDRYYQALYRKLLDPAIHQSSKNPILLRLIYQSMVGDDDTDRIVAFIHRILQLCISHTDPGFIPVNEVTSLAKFEQSDDDDEDEHFSDAHCSDDDNHNDESVQNGVMTNKTTESEKSTVITDKSNQRNTRNIFNYGYNPTVRDPKFAQATGCLLWSLSLLSKHIHPTINLFANSLLNNLPIQYTGDPFTDFGLMHFLDRFAYKKPKLNKLKETKSTTEEPIQKTVPGKLLKRKEGALSGPQAMAVDSSAFRQLPVTSVPVHERFFHK